MKKFLKWSAITVSVIILIVIAFISYITVALPNVGEPENIKVAATPQRLAHGKYLVMHVAGCVDCHSPRDWSKFAGPIDTNRLGGGGEKFDDHVGFPGVAYVPNITPSHLSSWTDGELFRAITCGVKKDGSTIFPIMPWPHYAQMDREDVYDIITYIRSLKPLPGDYAKTQLDFPLNIIVHTLPKKATLGKRPDEKDTLAYGGYLVNTTGCLDCHSRMDNGDLIPGLEYAGGREFKMNVGTVRSANITPDKVTGIGSWTKERFVGRFKAYENIQPPAINKGDFQTIMPWLLYRGMKQSDLEAIYTYLKTLKPVSNSVEKFKA